MDGITLSTKNIDKAIRTFKRHQAGLRCDDSIRCFKCGKRIRKNWIAMVNGFGGLNYYHYKCKISNLIAK